MRVDIEAVVFRAAHQGTKHALYEHLPNKHRQKDHGSISDDDAVKAIRDLTKDHPDKESMDLTNERILRKVADWRSDSKEHTTDNLLKWVRRNTRWTPPKEVEKVEKRVTQLDLILRSRRKD